MAYYVGNYAADAQDPNHHGWIVGAFMEEGPRKRDELEIKYWEFAAGDTSHPPKTSETLECTLLLKGKSEASIDGVIITMQAGDYVVIEPGTPNNLQHNILVPVAGITIKAPSDPSAKKLVEAV